MFYTYAHFTADTKELFYIGKGQRKRFTQTNGRSFWWKNKVNKHWFTAEVLSLWETEKEAFEHERFLISCFKGKLVNLTDGGEGASGAVHSKESRNKVRSALTGKPLTEARKKNISKALVGVKQSPERAEQSRKWLQSQVEKQKIKVRCVTTNTVFTSVSEAAKFTGVDASSIVKACKGKLKRPGGFQFEYA